MTENLAIMPFALNLSPAAGTAITGATVTAAEQTETATVEGPQDDVTMTSTPLSKADWRKLAIAGTGSVVIGAGAILSPIIPIGALAFGAVAVVVAGLRGERR